MMVGLRMSCIVTWKLVSMLSDNNAFQFQFGSSTHEAGKNCIRWWQLMDLVMMKFLFLIVLHCTLLNSTHSLNQGRWLCAAVFSVFIYLHLFLL